MPQHSTHHPGQLLCRSRRCGSNKCEGLHVVGESRVYVVYACVGVDCVYPNPPPRVPGWWHHRPGYPLYTGRTGYTSV